MNRALSDISRYALEHIELGTTDLGEHVTENPVSTYLDSSLFDLEMNHVLRNRPIPIVASATLPNEGDYLAKEICGVPLIVVRGEGGKLRVFLNVCRHRGAQLLSDGEGHDLKSIACPFHGWLYHISEGRGLVELKSMESVGMIWVLLDRKSNFSLEQSLNAFSEDFLHLGIEPRFPMKEFVHRGNFNWKIGVEAFLEVDHFPFAHAPYLSNIQFPGLSLADPVDVENYRIVVPLKKPEQDAFVLDWAQVMYFIFPSTFLLYYSDHVALLNLIPISVDKTEFRYIPLVPFEKDLDSQKIIEKADFLKVILQQDFNILEGIQKGLKSGANAQFTFTRTEHVLGHFHRTLRGFYV